MLLQELHDKLNTLGTTIYEIEKYYGQDYHNRCLAAAIRFMLTELIAQVCAEMNDHERKRKNAENQRRHRQRVRARLLECPNPSDYKN